MKLKILITGIILLLTSCIGTSYMEDEVIVYSVKEFNGNSEFKYTVEFKTTNGKSKFFTNKNYQVGDTLKICK